MKQLRVAIVGCGKIADQHASAIRRIPGATIVAACDLEELMAEQFADRHTIERVSGDVGRMLADARPDVVHITTPPASHFPLAIQCLEAGCHTYVEKPFTLNTADARAVISVARERGLQVIAGHNLQYTWENIDARELVRQGFLGGSPVHIESYYTYRLSNASYARAVLGDRQHWVRKLPGQLLHNIISHGVARIAEFMSTESPVVSAFGFTSPMLLQMGESGITDELRVHVFDGKNTTATFVFSSQLGPPANGFRLYGPSNTLVVDNVHHTLIRIRDRHFKSFVNYFVPPVLSACEQLRTARRNIARFVRSEFHDDSGLKKLIEAFYLAARGNGPTPISHREILLTSKIMDDIFECLRRRAECAASEGLPTAHSGAVAGQR